MGGGASRWRGGRNITGFPCLSPGNGSSPSHHHRNIFSSAFGNVEKNQEGKEVTSSATKALCPICLETLGNSGATTADDKCIFSAQCSHAFHLACIASNVKHGNITCPICRANWTYLPRDLSACQSTDPILRILDDSIATSRVNRRSFARTTRYDDDDPVEQDAISSRSHLHFSLVPVQHTMGMPPHCHPMLLHHCQLTNSSSISQHTSSPSGQKSFLLSVKLSHQQATDLVLIAIPNGPHLRLLKQAMSLAIFSLRPVDRVAIVTYSSSATRAFALRRMSSRGKRMALQVIDRLFYVGEADPMEGLQKGIKILEERTHQNPLSCMLYLSDTPMQALDIHVPFTVHQFHVGFGFGEWNGFVLHEFEEFIMRLLRGVTRDTQLRIGEEGEWMMLGELRGGEECHIALDLIGEWQFICVAYSYVEGGIQEQLRSGEIVVETGDKGDRDSNDHGIQDSESNIVRRSNAERWDYLDPFMARRWSKHLHGRKF